MNTFTRTVLMHRGETFVLNGRTLRFCEWRWSPAHYSEMAFCRDVASSQMMLISPTEMDAWRLQRIAKAYQARLRAI